MPARKDTTQKGKKPSHNNLKDGIEKLLESMSPEKRVERIKDIIADYVAKFEDESVLAWLKILLNEYETQSLNKEAGLICFRVYLRELYWKLPSSKVYVHIPFIAFPIAKKWILEHIIAEWEPNPNQHSISIFRFLIAACNPLHRVVPPREGESEYELKARGRELVPAEKKMIWELIKNHTGPAFLSGTLEVWMRLPWVPHEIQEILAKAWVRNGGWQELPRVLKRSDIFGLTAAEDYSSGAKMALHRWFEPLLTFEKQVCRLVDMLRSRSDIPEEVIVSAGYLNVACPGPLEVWIKANLKKHYSEQDGQAVFNQVLNIVMEWNKPAPNGGGRFIEGRRIIPHISVCGQNEVLEKFKFETTLGDI